MINLFFLVEFSIDDDDDDNDDVDDEGEECQSRAGQLWLSAKGTTPEYEGKEST